MSIIVSNCQHCNKQQFQTLSCVHYTIFSVIKLDLFIRALLLDRILALEQTKCTPCVLLVDYITKCQKKVILLKRCYLSLDKANFDNIRSYLN